MDWSLAKHPPVSNLNILWADGTSTPLEGLVGVSFSINILSLWAKFVRRMEKFDMIYI